MTISGMFRTIALIGGLLVLAACGVPPEDRAPAGPEEISELRQEIMSLGSDVDPDEADRAARIAYQHTRDLAIAYQITDPPLIHNSKVNMGLKPRGLCWHWAEDMEKRLDAEGFETLEMHRAIANADNAWRIEHSTAIVSAKGDDFRAGIVLDPWRKGGVLTHVPTALDPDYRWDPQEEILARKRARKTASRLR
ncbi:MAG: hypothetical protein OIF48_09525 [Silicimonas sp.]|nr:hypothetical protein [Silicimonas sp.]